MAVGDEILAMKRDAEKMERRERTDCPNDGWPLDKLADGTLHCPFDGWSDPPKLGARRHD
tara:strand:+ start:13173 stop:13352 length:180 start_codon:yes stop_codon:yes gene_type:complete